MKNWLGSFCFALIAGLAPQAHAAQAIDFKFTDSHGKTVQLSDHKGKWVLVNFWAPWCPRCKMEFQELNDLDARPDFVVIGVAMDYGIDEASVHSTIKRFNLRFPQIIGGNRRDADSPAMQVGPVDYYPTSYLYAPDGEIVMFIPGIISKQKIIAFTERHQQANPTAVARSEPQPAAAAAAIGSGIKKTNMTSPPANRTQGKKKVTVY